MDSPAQYLYERDGQVIAGVEKLRFFPLAVESGAGCWLTEVGGRRLLDLSATWTACGLGHGHPAITAAVHRASTQPPGAGGLSAVHPDSVGLAEDLLALTPGDDNRRVYLGHAGTDANDVALRCAKFATRRSKVLTFQHSYHGGLGVAMQASGVHVDAGSVTESSDVVFAPYPDPYRATPGLDPVTASIAAVDTSLAAGDVACVIVEPILSDGGLIVPPGGFLGALTDACRRHGVLLICDEVKVGLGRPGMMHAFERDGITPDIVTFGKALGGGLPLSAAIGPAAVLDEPVASALLTTAGNPICTAVGRTVLKTLHDEGLPQHAAAAGERFRTGLAQATDDLDCIGDIRGLGLVIGVDLVEDRTTKQRAPDLAAQTVYRLWELGAVAYYVGDNVLEITPPLIITDNEVDEAITLLAEAISDAREGKVDAERIKEFGGW